MSTLTDRYVFAVTRSLPEAQRADIDSELRASIADDIESRIDAGVSQAGAEKESLTSLGDPDRLAAGYSDRPSRLIGPELYFVYIRLLKLLYILVLPIAVIAVFIAGFIADDGIGEIFGRTWIVAITTAVHLGFWSTLVFAILDRTLPDKGRSWPVWTLDSLPQLPAKRQVGIADVVVALVMTLLMVGAVIWQQTFSVVSDASGPIPVLNPGLWAFWLPYFFALAALQVVFVIVLYRIGRWTFTMAAANIPLALAFAVPAVLLLANDLVLNPAFFDAMKWDASVYDITTNVLIGSIVVIAIWNVVDGFVKAFRARNESP